MSSPEPTQVALKQSELGATVTVLFQRSIQFEALFQKLIWQEKEHRKEH